MAGGHSHRSTVKKDHKPFKSKHATKGQLKNQYKGKVEKSTPSNSKAGRPLSKIERKNTAKQLKDKKIEDTRLVRKLFEGSNAAEKIITVIALTSDTDAAAILGQLVAAAADEDAMAAQFAAPAVVNMKLAGFRCSTKFILPDASDMISVLDAAKVSDYVVFGLSAQEEVSEPGEQVLRAVIAQGVATAVGVVPNLVSAYPKKNLQADVRQSLESFFQHFFPTEEKVYALDSRSEAQHCLRYISQKFPKAVNWRDTRGYMVASAAYVQADGLVAIEGIARGVGFNADRLVHLAGHGDFQLERIEQLARHKNDDAPAYAPTAAQDTLEELSPEAAAADGDGAGDDAWSQPDGVRMEGKTYFRDGAGGAARRFRAPEGTSEYQSKWLLDDVLEGASDAEEVSADEAMEVDAEEDAAMEDGEDEDGDAADGGYVELSPEDEAEQLRQFRAMESEEREFPDEIELEPRESARARLAEYRGIKSLGTCSWAWDEHDSRRPDVYGRLLRVRNFQATKHKQQKDAARDAQVGLGQRVRLVVRAPAAVLHGVNVAQRALAVYALLAHEHKLAVANFSFQTWEAHEAPVASGDPLIVQYGFRRQAVAPTFSQGSNSPNNVHKYQRFAHRGDTCVATAIAPVLFYNAPAIFFRRTASGVQLVGSGTFLNCDHARVLAERVVLTGHAVKIHKRLVTVRYMFFSPADINYFKAVPLFTKSGRTGFIKESLGTHGYFKATFDGRLTAQDVIGMALYRRVWPAPSRVCDV